MARHNPNTTPFTIAHYILLFLVTVICICIIAWVIIKRTNSDPRNNITPTITHISGHDSCTKRATNIVMKMWAYDPKSVPARYWQIATDYMNEKITARTYEICQDVAFTCRIGERRRDCDPCAVPSARAYAQSIQIADLIPQICP